MLIHIVCVCLGEGMHQIWMLKLVKRCAPGSCWHICAFHARVCICANLICSSLHSSLCQTLVCVRVRVCACKQAVRVPVHGCKYKCRFTGECVCVRGVCVRTCAIICLPVVHVCICVLAYVCVHICMCCWVGGCVRDCACVHMCFCGCAHVFVWVCVYVCACMWWGGV